MGGKASAPLRGTMASSRSRVPARRAHAEGVGRGGHGARALALDRERVDGGGAAIGSERMIEIQRARILAAMVEVCAERGAGNVTVAHIVESAGISRRTFYELYKDREECFLAAFDDAIARASRYVLESYDPSVKWLERIRGALIGLLSFLDRERGAGRLLIVDSLGAGDLASERRRRCIAQMIALVDQGRTQSKVGAYAPPLTAEGIVGGVLSVLYARLIDAHDDSLLELAGPLMSMIVLPYLGPAAARHQLVKPVPAPPEGAKTAPADPLRDVQMRLTYRTVRVLMAVAANPGSSNRDVGLAADIQDQGQISKLLTRLSKLALVENSGAGLARGAPNAWILTAKGAEIEQAIGEEFTS